VLKPENRLRARQDFDHVKREGKRWRGDLLSLSVVACHAGPSRFGFVVSKQVAPKAAARNRLKRQMRAIVRNVIVNIASGHDCVFVARYPAANADYYQLAEQMAQFVTQAGLRSKQIENQL